MVDVSHTHRVLGAGIEPSAIIIGFKRSQHVQHNRAVFALARVLVLVRVCVCLCQPSGTVITLKP